MKKYLVLLLLLLFCTVSSVSASPMFPKIEEPEAAAAVIKVWTVKTSERQISRSTYQVTVQQEVPYTGTTVSVTTNWERVTYEWYVETWRRVWIAGDPNDPEIDPGNVRTRDERVARTRRTRTVTRQI